MSSNSSSKKKQSKSNGLNNGTKKSTTKIGKVPVDLKNPHDPEPEVDLEKVEAFRRIVSAEDFEELDDNHGNSNDYDNSGVDTAYGDGSDSGVNDFLNMDPEQRQQAEEEMRNELVKTEEEINTLRQVLASKMKHATELKRKLGITVWKEFQNDLGQGVKNIQETTAYSESVKHLTQLNTAIQSAPIYQKTSELVKGAGERTVSVFGGLGESLRNKLGEVKNSNTFKSFEERVGNTVYTVKSKMGGSRSSSMNFDETLDENRRNSQTAQQTAPIVE